MKRPFLTVLALVIGLQFFSRYAAAPVPDFTVDDWAILARARACPSYADAAALMLKDPDRPLSAGVLTMLFKVFDDRPWCWALFSVATYSILVSLLVLLARRLDGRPLFALLAGAVFALLPNLTESFLWPTMVAYVGGLIAYLASALCWISYVRTSRARDSVLAGMFLLIALASYEVGIGLPFAFLCLIDPARWRRQITGWIPCLIAVAAYLAWKLSAGFGLAHGVLFAPRHIGFSPEAAVWNARETASWWAGEKMFSCVASGWDTLQSIGKWPWRFFYVINIAVAALFAIGVKQAAHSEEDSAPATRLIPGSQVLLFGLAWTAVTAGISLLSWTAGRLNIIPAVGVSIVIARLLTDRPTLTWLPASALVVLLCLAANQGIAVQWRDTGIFNRRLYNYICAQAPAWRKAEAVLFDTRALRQRLTPGLLTAPTASEQAWAYYHSASLLRGFAPDGMMRLAVSGERIPAAILDVECDAHWENGVLSWHDRWDPARPHRTERDSVYVIDCFEAGTRACP